MAAPPPGPQGWGPNLALLLGSVALCLAAFETTLRVLGDDGSPPPPRRVEVWDGGEGTWHALGLWGTGKLKQRGSVPGTEKVGEYRPSLTFRFVYADPHPEGTGFVDRPVLHHTNTLGLRGGEVSAAKPPGTFRILSLGDSFTFGDGVADDETFSARLAARLRARGPQGSDQRSDTRSYEVLNAGVSGFNTAHEVAFLEHRGLALDPDLVLVTFYLNDAYDDARFADLIMGGAAGAQIPGLAPSTSPSFSIRWLSNRWRRWTTSRRIVDLYAAQFSAAPVVDGHDWQAAQDALAHARDLTRARGVGLALIIFPELHALGDDHPFTGIYAAVAACARQLEVPVLDLFPTYRGRDPASLWVHVTDHHPNATAHLIASDAIAAFLETKRLVPPP